MPKPNDDKRLTREQLGYVRHHSAEWASDVAREALTLHDERDEARAKIESYKRIHREDTAAYQRTSSENRVLRDRLKRAGFDVTAREDDDPLRRENERLQGDSRALKRLLDNDVGNEFLALRELHKAADDLRTQVIEYDKVDEEQELLVAVVTNAEFHALCDALDKLERDTEGEGMLDAAHAGWLPATEQDELKALRDAAREEKP